MQATVYQALTKSHISQGKSLLLVAPTGLGKTFAVTGDLEENFCKTVYAVPLRALGNDIRRSVNSYRRNNQSINAVIHHGGLQESTLFGEEFVVTTYDQIVCGTPGLPLSLPLKSGHAVAGALLMSRLILDEAHLAWGISEQALAILLAIVKFRQSFGLQTVLMTATLPDAVSILIADRLGLERILIGKGGEVQDDESLYLRDQNRIVKPELLDIKKKSSKKAVDDLESTELSDEVEDDDEIGTRKKGKAEDDLNFEPLDQLLKNEDGKCIYFANTVDRIQNTYDRLIEYGVSPEMISVLHNRMPHKWRNEREEQVKARFGKDSPDEPYILLTNQVAEAGLDISAPLVVSDPAPVDTLVQRSGRCARWFRDGETKGKFIVLKIPGLKEKNSAEPAIGYVKPYRIDLTAISIKLFPETVDSLTWDVERQWVNQAWGGGEKEALEKVEESINQTAFALNLFDRAAQDNKPGEIANVFREVLSVEVAVSNGNSNFIDDFSEPDAHKLLSDEKFPDTSSISLARAWRCLKEASGRAQVIRFDLEESQFQLTSPDYIQLGDILILPSTIAYLHTQKGLCFDNNRDETAILNSEWSVPAKKNQIFTPGLSQRQTLLDHSSNVMTGTRNRFTDRDNLYRKTLRKILEKLEPSIVDHEGLTDLVANLACVAAGFHDLGKADMKWQAKVRKTDPGLIFTELVGRSLSACRRIGRPHTPPGYAATVAACKMLLGTSDQSSPLDPLIKAIALATCRHHSSFLNPSRVENYEFEPHPDIDDFISKILSQVGASSETLSNIKQIIEAAIIKPKPEDVPLMLPNEDLFPIYALVGRAIMMADREDAGGQSLEQLK